ncbi:MAG: glucosidase [Candidatus Eisenbacteria bacterium]|uniref:Glucosidase n=1 Tax=Eiseniibacteriota bacterium TaxID=2212470 RepID=A0A956NEQ7_UNCEI|nr:glucosidase [Candidatus Eisenbacteria bacterium]
MERGAEHERLDEDARGDVDWRQWGPYLSERQWGTVREDYSENGDVWGYFPHEHARSRVYRWGEDGIFGISDRDCRLCFALTVWNGRDPILKERFFGVSGPEGNHGEDVKEVYEYLDATPTSSYLSALYRYPQQEYPYDRLLEESGRRTRQEPEFELEDTGILDDGRYFDVVVEYAKAGPEDVLVRVVCHNRGPEDSEIHLLPTLWLRNTWAWGREGSGYWGKGRISQARQGGAGQRTSLQGERIVAELPEFGRYFLDAVGPNGESPTFLFTDNETNVRRLYGVANSASFQKDAFHHRVVDGDETATNPENEGTKAAAWFRLTVAAGRSEVIRLRLRRAPSDPDARVSGATVSDTSVSDGRVSDTSVSDTFVSDAFGSDFEAVLEQRKSEADEFYAGHRKSGLSDEERLIVRRADAGLLWSRQFYHYIVEHWLDGDPTLPPPPEGHATSRNTKWRHLWAQDVLSMPDNWEYPWFAAWDLAFHAVATVRIDPEFAKRQVLLLCREWYMHPNGEVPAYEFSFDDANPPLVAWAGWRVYELSRDQGRGEDREFLATIFQKCLINFTWWINQEDSDGNNLFSGGFLGLDNIGVFDRSRPIAGVGKLEQADATSWMAFYASTMLAIALELAVEDTVYEGVALKFFDHFLAIARAMNEIGGDGLWDDQDGFYYDRLHAEGSSEPMRVRSMVGIIPLFAAESLQEGRLERVPLFQKRLEWFLRNHPKAAESMACLNEGGEGEARLLAIPSRDRLARVLRYVFDEGEFLSPYGVRSLSKFHDANPYRLEMDGNSYEIRYVPGESDSGLFGGNSNWRGPVWVPLNYLLIEALKRHHHFYGDEFRVELPTGSGREVTLLEAAEDLERRIARLFLPGDDGTRPSMAGSSLAGEPDHVLFHEYFHAETGKGLGASHQTGWTALVANVLERVASVRARRGK